MEPLRSSQFDDVYFSAADGLAETRHVFLAGNHLPQAWREHDDFVIAEAGFGTGLNFLATMQLFQQTTKPAQRLHYIAFEQFPLDPEQIRAALAGWWPDIGSGAEQLLAHYPLPVPGFHRIILSPKIFLTLIIGDINQKLPELRAAVDAWYLDGFAPAKNPAMWSATVFQEIKRLSAPGATAATFSVARVVKDGLAGAGFALEKKPGFGRKAEMLTARLPGERISQRLRRGQKVAILGGGLAGTAAAYVLKQHGHQPTVIAPFGLADGASGNPRGIYNPRFSKQATPMAQFFSSGYALLHRQLRHWREDVDIGWQETGTLHLVKDDDQRARLAGIHTTWAWPESCASFVRSEQASDLAGVKLRMDCLHLPHGGTLSPAALCRAYARDIPVVTEYDVSGYDAVVLAAGQAVKMWPECEHLPLQTVRGQISLMTPNAASMLLKTNLCYGGYLAPVYGGTHVLGATFQPWSTDTNVNEEDHTYVINELTTHVGKIFDGAEVTGGRAALRVTMPDRNPLIGRVRDGAEGHGKPPVYCSTAHGSHGLVSSLAAAHLIADEISNGPESLPLETTRDLSLQRLKYS